MKWCRNRIDILHLVSIRLRFLLVQSMGIHTNRCGKKQRQRVMIFTLGILLCTYVVHISLHNSCDSLQFLSWAAVKQIFVFCLGKHSLIFTILYLRSFLCTYANFISNFNSLFWKYEEDLISTIPRYHEQGAPCSPYYLALLILSYASI
jgi:hypothetical protein